MSPGLRVIAAIAIILFLVVAGLLGALQDLQGQFVRDPVFAAELGERIFPIGSVAGTQPYQYQDVRERFQMAAVYSKSAETPSDGIIMIVASLPPGNLKLDGEIDRGMRKEWDEGSFKEVGNMSLVSLVFRDTPIMAQEKNFRDANGATRRQFVTQLNWGEQLIVLTINGPSEQVTREVLQAALNGIEGEALPLIDPPVEVDENGEPVEKAAA